MQYQNCIFCPFGKFCGIAHLEITKKINLIDKLIEFIIKENIILNLSLH